jgi:hypothetical protein
VSQDHDPVCDPGITDGEAWSGGQAGHAVGTGANRLRVAEVREEQKRDI